METVVIVGAGLAGYTAAATLRTDGYAGRILLLGAESEPPYDRPQLSKRVVTGAWSTERTFLTSAEALREQQIDFVCDRADGLSLGERVVTTASGRRHGYDHLVIATGVEPIRLPFAPDAQVLRTLADSRAIQTELHPGSRLVVVGGGFLGLELAGSAASLGCDVSVIEPMALPLGNKLGANVACELVRRLEEYGVRIHAGATVDRCDRDGDGWTVHLTGAEPLRADALVAAAGSRPSTTWLESSGLEIDNGVVCDETCAAHESVWAVGDVANVNGIRVEHRTNAQEQGTHVARSIMSGKPTPFLHRPFFWTDHPGIKIQVWGSIPPRAELEVVEGDLESDRMVGVFRASPDDAVTAVIAWNAAKESLAWRRLLTADQHL